MKIRRKNPSYGTILILDEPRKLGNEEFIEMIPSPLWAMQLGVNILFASATLIPHRAKVVGLADQYLSYRLQTRAASEPSLTTTLRKLHTLYEPEWLRFDFAGNLMVAAGKENFVLPAVNTESYEVIIAGEKTMRNMDHAMEVIFEKIERTVKS